MRPNVVWFNESLDRKIMSEIGEELDACDLFLIVTINLNYKNILIYS